MIEGRHGSFEEIGTGRVMAEFLALYRHLNAAGIKAFAMAGTLLGLVRDGHLIQHDKDVDIGVMDEVTLERVAAEIGPHYDLVERSGYDIPFGKIVWLYRFIGDNLAIPFEFQCHYTQKHLYFYNRLMDNTWNCYETHVTYHMSLLKEFKTIQVLGEDVLVPSAAEDWLKAFYGDDWKTPKKYSDWRYECPLFTSGWMTQMPLES